MKIKTAVELACGRLHRLDGGITKTEVRQQIELAVFEYSENPKNLYHNIVAEEIEGMRNLPNWNSRSSVFNGLTEKMQKVVLNNFVTKERRRLTNIRKHEVPIHVINDILIGDNE